MATVRDSFDRADNATTMGDADTGQTWVPAAGTWQIESNKATTSSTSSVTTLIESEFNDVIVECDITWGSGGSSTHGMIFRALDDDNRLGIFINPSVDEFAIWKTDGGSTLKLNPVTVTLDEAVTYTLKAECEGQFVRCYLDGALQFTYDLADIAGDDTQYTGAGYTKCGLRGSTSTTWDNFFARYLRSGQPQPRPSRRHRTLLVR